MFAKSEPVLATGSTTASVRSLLVDKEDIETIAEKVADFVWRMHHLDKDETIDNHDWDAFRKRIIILLAKTK